MDPIVFAAVLAGALLHAGWNALVRIGLDRASTVLLLALVQGALALLLLPFAPVPAAAAWPWIFVSGFLHAGYKIFLVEAYARADLSQAYPLARGAAPLIVTVFSVIFLSVTFAPSALLAVLAISAGIGVMALKGGAAPMRGTALFFALGTAGFTAAYTLVDGLGARIAGTAMGFVLWMVVIDTVVMCAVSALRRGPTAFTALRPHWRSGLAVGAMSLGSYWIATWAFTKAPIALVAALRETSILFAVLIAAFVLREPVSRWRWGASGLILGGVVMMRL